MTLQDLEQAVAAFAKQQGIERRLGTGRPAEPRDLGSPDDVPPQGAHWWSVVACDVDGDFVACRECHALPGTDKGRAYCRGLAAGRTLLRPARKRT